MDGRGVGEVEGGGHGGTVEFCGTPVRRPFAFDGTYPMPLAATIDFLTRLIVKALT